MNSSLWFGVGAAAAVASAIAAAIGLIIAYRRGRSSRVVVTASEHPFEYPPPIMQTLKLLEPFMYYGEFDGEFDERPAQQSLAQHLAQQRATHVRNLVTLLKDDPTLRRLIIGFPLESLWRISIKNLGHERAESVQLQIPNGKLSMVKGSDGNPTTQSGSVVRIPELRPGETVSIRTWADRSLGKKPSLVQAKGRAVVRMGNPDL